MLFLNVFFRTLGFLTALLVFSIIFSIFFQLTNNSQKNQFIITDGDEDSKNTIAKINLNGPILNDANKFLGNNFYDYINPDLVETYLEDLKKIKTKILVVNINSPGGTVSATADLEKIFYEFKKETNTKSADQPQPSVKDNKVEKVA